MGSTLHLTTVGGYTTVTEKFLTARCNVDLETKRGTSPLHLTVTIATYGHSTITNQLIVTICNIDTQDEMGYTPFHFTAGAGSGRHNTAAC